MAKKTLTLNLNDEEMRVLEELAAKKDITKTAVLKLALRFYQLLDQKVSLGDKFFFESEDRKDKAELILL